METLALIIEGGILGSDQIYIYRYIYILGGKVDSSRSITSKLFALQIKSMIVYSSHSHSHSQPHRHNLFKGYPQPHSRNPSHTRSLSRQLPSLLQHHDHDNDLLPNNWLSSSHNSQVLTTQIPASHSPLSRIHILPSL